MELAHVTRKNLSDLRHLGRFQGHLQKVLTEDDMPVEDSGCFMEDAFADARLLHLFRDVNEHERADLRCRRSIGKRAGLGYRLADREMIDYG